MSENNQASFDLPESLLWLMDASLFIDDDLIDRYYDAIVRPLHSEGKRTIQITEANVHKIAAKLSVGAEIQPSAEGLLGKLVSSIFDAKVTANGEVAGEGTGSESNQNTVELEPVNTPHRRLEQLALHYLVNYTNRIFLEDDTKTMDGRKDQGPVWHNQGSILKTPRSLAFFNLPSQKEAEEHGTPETCLIPTAVEFENGEVIPLYQDLNFGTWTPPTYPNEADSLEQLQEDRRNYWREFQEHYDATTALITVEKAASINNRGKIRWIDFRVPLTNDGDSLHLHIKPSGNYDTGTFAYNMIKRGQKYGLRIVGMLKSEPDLNVLAVFEK